jgi:hypothetical protein
VESKPVRPAPKPGAFPYFGISNPSICVAPPNGRGLSKADDAAACAVCVASTGCDCARAGPAASAAQMPKPGSQSRTDRPRRATRDLLISPRPSPSARVDDRRGQTETAGLSAGEFG